MSIYETQFHTDIAKSASSMNVESTGFSPTALLNTVDHFVRNIFSQT